MNSRANESQKIADALSYSYCSTVLSTAERAPFLLSRAINLALCYSSEDGAALNSADRYTHAGGRGGGVIKILALVRIRYTWWESGIYSSIIVVF